MEPTDDQYDVFIATPMSVLRGEAYDRHRRLVMDIIGILEHELGFARVYYAGREIADAGQFTEPGKGVLRDITALRNSRAVCFIYPVPCATSALMEVGGAMALLKPVFILTPHHVTLPRLFENAARDPSPVNHGTVKILRYQDESSLLSLLRSEGINALTVHS